MSSQQIMDALNRIRKTSQQVRLFNIYQGVPISNTVVNLHNLPVWPKDPITYKSRFACLADSR